MVKPGARPHILRELGLTIDGVGEELRGSAVVAPEIWAPRTDTVRISALAAWADVVMGHLVARVLARLPLMLDLDVHLFQGIRGCDEIEFVASVVKASQSVATCAVHFTGPDGERLGFANGLVMASQDLPPTARTNAGADGRLVSSQGAMPEPFAVRAGCDRLAQGVASLPCEPHVIIGGKSLNGGIVALVVEEAVLSGDADARAIASMTLRYLRPVRTGPAVARAEIQGGLCTIEVHDAGTNELAVLATTRFFDSEHGASESVGPSKD